MPASRHNPERYFQRRVTIPRTIAYPRWWIGLAVVLATSSILYFAFFENALVFAGGVLSALRAAHIAYMAHVLLDVAARIELNNAVLADMLHKAQNPVWDRYWADNAVYVEKDLKR